MNKNTPHCVDTWTIKNVPALASAIFNDMAWREQDGTTEEEIKAQIIENPIDVIDYLVDRFILADS